MQDTGRDINIALLVDVDNISSRYVESILSELSKYGKVTYRRLYGDWSQTRLRGWLQVAQKYSLTPIMQPNNSPGKNASDIGLIIDAMDILYSDQVQGFCIASSDGDFNKLATRLREAGMLVIGMGEVKTPESFRASCERFVFLNVLQEDDDIVSESSRSRSKKKTTKRSSKKTEYQDSMVAEQDLSDIYGRTDDESDDFGYYYNEDGLLDKDIIENVIVRMISDNQAEGRVTGLGEIGQRLVKIYPDFDARNYGYTKLSAFLKDMNSLAVSSDGMWVSLKSSSLNDIETRIKDIYRENKTDALNVGLLKSELEKRIPNLDATIKDSGVARFSVFLLRNFPFIHLEKDGNLAVMTGSHS